MKMYSDAFLNDSYLKYVGWTMHDKVNGTEQREQNSLVLVLDLSTLGLGLLTVWIDHCFPYHSEILAFQNTS